MSGKVQPIASINCQSDNEPYLVVGLVPKLGYNEMKYHGMLLHNKKYRIVFLACMYMYMHFNFLFDLFYQICFSALKIY